MKKAGMFMGIAFGLLAGCVEPPASEMELQARVSKAAELAVLRCAAYTGGFENAQALKMAAEQAAADARALGATDAVFAKAAVDAERAFSSAVALNSLPEACNQLVGRLGWITA